MPTRLPPSPVTPTRVGDDPGEARVEAQQPLRASVAYMSRAEAATGAAASSAAASATARRTVRRFTAPS